MNAYLKENEAEKKVLRAQIKRLCQENNWLREQVENNPKGDPNDPGMNPDAQDDQQQARNHLLYFRSFNSVLFLVLYILH